MAGRNRIGAIVVVAAAVGIFAWLLLKDDDESTKESTGVGPVEVSSAELDERAGAAAIPVYWAGERAGNKLEYTQTATGRIFVRYLPLDTPIGEKRPDYLTVGTYPAGNAYGALET